MLNEGSLADQKPQLRLKPRPTSCGAEHHQSRHLLTNLTVIHIRVQLNYVM